MLVLCASCEGSITVLPIEPVATPHIETTQTDFTTGPQLRRLSRNEYQYTVTDLFGQSFTNLEIPRELVVAGHSTIAGAQLVGYSDTNAFLEASERIAEQVAPALAAELGRCTTAACSAAWVRAFVSRAFRFEVDGTILERYQSILAAPEAGSSPVEHVGTLVMSVLNSPNFLYRKEIGAASSSAVRTLTNAEIASRLSCLLWQSVPDAELTSANLSDAATRNVQVSRMLGNAKANRGIRAFVRDWAALNDNKIASKTTATLAGLSATVAADAETSFDLLVDDVTGKPGGTFTGLLSATQSFVNAALAPIFGLTSTQPGFQRVQLDSEKRVGLLSHPLSLSAHTKESGVSPFPLGAFVLENIACESVGKPPAVFREVEESANSGTTLRQDLEARTSSASCIGCHRRIGPTGFSFLNFDPVGRYSAADGKGRPYDASGSFVFERSKTTAQFSNAAGLSVELAKAVDVKHCVARRLFRFAHGRYEGPDDASVIAQLKESAVVSDTSAERLIRCLVSSDTFTQVRISAN